MPRNMPRKFRVFRAYSPAELEDQLNRWLKSPEPTTQPDLKVGPIHNMVQSQSNDEIILTIIYQLEEK